VFPPVNDKATEKLDCVHMDHCGPITPTTFGNAGLVFNLRDEATSHSWSYPVADRFAATIVSVLTGIGGGQSVERNAACYYI
jgi:hypothetical protein